MPGDRRDEDHMEYGRLASKSFDSIIVREDKNRRGRKVGESAELVLKGIARGQAEGARCTQARAVVDELDAAVEGLRASSPGDLVMVCADDIQGVYRRLMDEARSRNGGASAIADPGEFAAAEG